MDLNLLTALDALLKENSVQAAADRLHLSPPAMSRTLARIRKATGDEILVRTGRTMTPTPRALAIRDEVRAMVDRAGELLTPARTLDLPHLPRTFTIQGHDVLLGELSPCLLAAPRPTPPERVSRAKWPRPCRPPPSLWSTEACLLVPPAFGPVAQLSAACYCQMEFSCQACRLLTVAVPPTAKASTPVLEGSGKTWSVNTTCSPAAFCA